MVDVMGHLAMGLLWALPAWFLWSDRVALTFVGLTLLTAMLPDVDLVLQGISGLGVHHHGVTHTMLFVGIVSLLAGAVATLLLSGDEDQWFGLDRFDDGATFAFTTGAFLTGGLAHLFADMLSAPDIATPIEPFWPLFDKPWSVDLIWYNSPWWNLGLLIVAVLAHAAVGYAVDPRPHRYRVRRA